MIAYTTFTFCKLNFYRTFNVGMIVSVSWHMYHTHHTPERLENQRERYVYVRTLYPVPGIPVLLLYEGRKGGRARRVPENTHRLTSIVALDFTYRLPGTS